MYKDSFESVEVARKGIQMLKNAAFRHYSILVAGVLEDKIIDKQDILKILNGLSDFCNERRFRVLWKEVCRHINRTLVDEVGGDQILQ